MFGVLGIYNFGWILKSNKMNYLWNSQPFIRGSKCWFLKVPQFLVNLGTTFFCWITEELLHSTYRFVYLWFLQEAKKTGKKPNGCKEPLIMCIIEGMKLFPTGQLISNQNYAALNFPKMQQNIPRISVLAPKMGQNYKHNTILFCNYT